MIVLAFLIVAAVLAGELGLPTGSRAMIGVGIACIVAVAILQWALYHGPCRPRHGR